MRLMISTESHSLYFSCFLPPSPLDNQVILAKGKGENVNYGHSRFLIFPDFFQMTQGRQKYFVTLWSSFWETGATISLSSAELCVNLEEISITFQDNTTAFQNLSSGKISLVESLTGHRLQSAI